VKSCIAVASDLFRTLVVAHVVKLRVKKVE
jgi:hypothetical protein